MASSSFISNAPESDRLDLDTARAVLDSYGGLAKSCRYYVRLVPANGSDNYLLPYANDMRDLSYLCDAAEFPGRGLMTTDLRYYGTNFKAPYQTTYEDLNLTFICRDDFGERGFFDQWMERINPVSTFNFSYRNQYECYIDIFQLSDLDPGDGSSTAVYSWRFDHAYPVLINPQPVTWADDNFHRLTVSFTYQRWYRPSLDVADATGFSLINSANINNIDGGPQLYNTNFRNPDPSAAMGRSR